MDGRQITEIFDQALKGLPTPSVAQSGHASAEQKVGKSPVLRITELTVRPIEAGKALILDVRYINDRNEAVTVIGHYAREWVETMPDDIDIAGITQIENRVWEEVAQMTREGPKLKIDIPPKVGLQSSTDQNALVMTDELIKKLDNASAVYIAGEFEDISGHYSPTAYCVRVDKKSRGQQVQLCHSLSLPKQQ